MATTASPLPQRSRYKCWMLWDNDMKKTFYSYDSSGRYKVESDEYGLKGLQKRMLRQYPERIKKAIIYDNQSGAKLYELQGGQWVEARA